MQVIVQWYTIVTFLTIRLQIGTMGIDKSVSSPSAVEATVMTTTAIPGVAPGSQIAAAAASIAGVGVNPLAQTMGLT